MGVTEKGKDLITPEDIEIFESYLFGPKKTPIQEGTSALIYRYKNYAIKKYLTYSSDSNMAHNEASILTHLSAVSGSFPSVYYFDDHLIVMDYIEGKNLSEYRPTVNFLSELANYFASVFYKAKILPVDLHVGNVILDNDGTVYIVDVAEYKTLNEDEADLDLLHDHVLYSLEQSIEWG